MFWVLRCHFGANRDMTRHDHPLVGHQRDLGCERIGAHTTQEQTSFNGETTVVCFYIARQPLSFVLHVFVCFSICFNLAHVMLFQLVEVSTSKRQSGGKSQPECNSTGEQST